MPKITAHCKQCGKTLEFYPSQARQYCSMSCRSTWLAQSGMPTKPRTGHFRSCERCGTDFWVIKSAEGKRRYCSKPCHDLEQTADHITKTCATCGKSFDLKPSQAVFRGSERVYCSRACMGRGKMRRALDREHNGKPAVVDSGGYVRVYEPSHPNAFKNGWFLEHRLVMEQALGRYLRTDEQVHHLNHVRTDNRPENLTLMTQSEHSRTTGRQNGEALRSALEARQKLAEYRRRFGPI